mmetsp:Transcript_61479/g.181698  ORF Transcript_61479/g.181698 Transcript_61479/m.181698 type:complete len:95 (+) Transcript_61479:488-772(+)
MNNAINAPKKPPTRVQTMNKVDNFTTYSSLVILGSSKAIFLPAMFYCFAVPAVSRMRVYPPSTATKNVIEIWGENERSLLPVFAISLYGICLWT